VRRPDERLIAERRELRADGVVEDARVLARLLALRQVGAARRADEERVAREDVPRRALMRTPASSSSSPSASLRSLCAKSSWSRLTTFAPSFFASSPEPITKSS
jgi:hypothetical protein